MNVVEQLLGANTEAITDVFPIHYTDNLFIPCETLAEPSALYVVSFARRISLISPFFLPSTRIFARNASTFNSASIAIKIEVKNELVHFSIIILLIISLEEVV